MVFQLSPGHCYVNPPSQTTRSQMFEITCPQIRCFHRKLLTGFCPLKRCQKRLVNPRHGLFSIVLGYRRIGKGLDCCQSIRQLKLGSHQTRMYYGPPRMAPNPPGSNLCRSGVVRGRPGWLFLLRQSKFVDDSSASRQRYELLRHRHGIITDGAGATTK